MNFHRSGLIFVVLVLLVIFSQIILLKPIIGQGLTNEDYVGFFKVRLYGDKFFTSPIYVWTQIGLHDAAHDFYIGFLNFVFKENYNMYLYSNISLKIIATLTLYPLILIITKNKLLSFLTTLLYGMSYPSAGALYLYVVGNEYLGVALMNIFLISYFLYIEKTRYFLLMLTSLLIVFSYLVSPIRIFPIFAVILLVELFILIQNKSSNFIPSILRVVAIFLPIAVITASSMENSGSGAYSLAGLPDFLKRITDGNWYLLLNPLWGLGYTFLPVAYFHIFGRLDVSSFTAYLGSLLITPLIIFSIAGIFLSFIMSKKRLRFFLILMWINLVLDIIMFILYTHHFKIPSNLLVEYAGPSFDGGLYAGILSSLIISISITTGVEWYLTHKKNQLLFLIFISPFISLLFIISQWLFTRQYYTYSEGIHRYFVIPAIGSYFFLSSLMVMVYQRRKAFPGFLATILIIFFLFLIFNISKSEIAQVFYGKRGSGKDLKLQQSMQNQAFSFIPKDSIKDDLLIFIKFKSNKLGDANQWEDTFDWRNLTFWMHIKRSYLTGGEIDGCIAMTWDFQWLKKMAKIQEGSRGFLYKNEGNQEVRCLRNGVGYSMDGQFIKLDNLYAFAIDGPKVINITEEVKKELLFSDF